MPAPATLRPTSHRLLRAAALSAAALAGAALVAHLTVARAGGVASRITIPEDFADAAGPPPPHGAYRTVPLFQLDIDAPPYAPASELVAALVGKGEHPADVPALLLSVHGGQLTPAASVVPKGTKLSFRNECVYEHHLYADAAGFDAGVLGKDKTSTEVALSKPGTIIVKDRLWPHVEALIIVLDDALILPVTPGAPGPPAIAEVKITGATPGPHELRLYFRGEVVHRAPVDVPDGAGDVKVAVTLTPFVPPPPASAPAEPASAPAPDKADKADDGDAPAKTDKPDKKAKADGEGG